jgi:hypothetical protein
VKRQLPTLSSGRGGRNRGAPARARIERRSLARPVIAIGYANQSREAAQFTLQLCAALVARGMKVCALVASRSSEPIAEASLPKLLEAGVSEAKWVQVPQDGGADLLGDALAKLPTGAIVISLGNALPELYRPFFTVMVTGHRRHPTSDDVNVMRADLEITTASDGLAEELGRVLQSRLEGFVG